MFETPYRIGGPSYTIVPVLLWYRVILQRTAPISASFLNNTMSDPYGDPASYLVAKRVIVGLIETYRVKKDPRRTGRSKRQINGSRVTAQVSFHDLSRAVYT